MFDFLKNALLYRGKYKTHSEAVIVACFYNPENSPYRLLAFQKWYRSIKHLHHRVIECLIGPDARSQLPESPYITQVRTDTLLWHKETLLNKLVRDLPPEFRYVFVLDADVLFTNDNWLVDSVAAMEAGAHVVQPFEWCVHLERNQLRPGFNVDEHRQFANDPRRHPMLWRSFCANHPRVSAHTNYDIHGHVGFAWGFRREVLERCPLYEKALIGGADHILAHAAAGHVPHECITKSFTEDLDDVLDWSARCAAVVQGRLGYAPGDLYHIWHGDIADRQYLQRIRDFTPHAKDLEQDEEGFYVADDRSARYMRKYYRRREAGGHDDFGELEMGFYEDMGYLIGDIINLFGQPYTERHADPEPAPEPVEWHEPHPVGGRSEFETDYRPPATVAEEIGARSEYTPESYAPTESQNFS